MLHIHTLASGGVEVWPITTREWEQPVCSPGADLGLCSPNETGAPDLLTAVRRHLGWKPTHWEREKGRAKLIRYFPVYILQVSRLDGPVDRLIGAATAPGTGLARRLDCLPESEIV